MEKIICSNNIARRNGECFYSGEKFLLNEGISYTVLDHDVSPCQAARRGFFLAEDFKLPFGINSKQKLGTYLNKTLGLARNSEGYMDAYSRWSALLSGEPLNKELEGKPRRGEIGFFDLKTHEPDEPKAKQGTTEGDPYLAQVFADIEKAKQGEV